MLPHLCRTTSLLTGLSHRRTWNDPTTHSSTALLLHPIGFLDTATLAAGLLCLFLSFSYLYIWPSFLLFKKSMIAWSCRYLESSKIIKRNNILRGYWHFQEHLVLLEGDACMCSLPFLSCFQSILIRGVNGQTIIKLMIKVTPSFFVNIQLRVLGDVTGAFGGLLKGVLF